MVEPRALIVEDRPEEAQVLRARIKEFNFDVLWVKTPKEAFRALRDQNFAVALVDFQLGEEEGLEILRNLPLPSPPVYMMSAFGTIPRAVEALRLGARDFLEKPLGKSTLQKILASVSLPSRTINPLSAKSPGIICHPSSPLKETLEMCRLAGPKSCSVYLRGESGSGKEVFADLLHQLHAPAGPLVKVNCAAVPENLFEAELFGYVKGAFTGAHQDSRGKIRAAEGGTLFLDEVADMPVYMQTKLLRVLQEKSVTPLGQNLEIPVDFRLVCASHKDLREEVNKGKVREDLYYRLDVFRIPVLPLRDRLMDLKPLLYHWWQNTPLLNDLDILVPLLREHTWPGNIRELKNFSERYALERERDKTPETIWREYLKSLGASISKKPNIREENPIPHLNRKPQDSEIIEALNGCGFHRQMAADSLGISKRNLQYRLARMREN